VRGRVWVCGGGGGMFYSHELGACRLTK